MNRIPSTLALLSLAATLSSPAATATGIDRIADARHFVALLASDRIASATEGFDATMSAALPESKLREVWSAVQAQAGEFLEQSSARVERAGRYQIVFVTCRFARAVLDVKVAFDETGRIAGLFFVPSRPPVPWQAPAYCSAEALREIEVEVGADGWPLPGTLTLPAGDGTFPVVVLVHGSGAHDRDETIGPNKPFADLACGLASRGVAVLRYVKRTLQHAGRLVASDQPFTVDDEAVDDALTAVAAARSDERIDPRRVFVLGHSLGGMLIPRIGQRDQGLAGLVVLAGTARPLEEVILEQLAYIRSLESANAEATAEAIDAIEIEVARVRALDSAALGSAERILGAPPAYWLDLRSYRPAEAARTLTQPMLILQGERDYQVTMEDFRLWQAALADRPDVALVSYPDLNHLFMPGEGRATPAEYEVSGHVAETVVEQIARWVDEQGPTEASTR